MTIYLKKLILISACCVSVMLQAQTIQSPDSFLNYPIGSQFTYHHRMVDYFRHVAENSPKVQLFDYGETYEGRPLILAAVSSAENIQQLDAIRTSNLANAGFVDMDSDVPQIPIVWYGYSVHGNESVAMEAAIATLYAIVENDTANWLDDMVLLIDPCLNPDGRERYTTWYRQAANSLPNPDIDSWEHHEPWPGGRFNHYLFDLNRDWCWQTQIETQQRIDIYHEWMPHVAIDYHEMGPNSPFFFGPAAQPFHEVITDWQREFQELVGRNNANYFDRYSWLYFTREIFDLLYPSYGDTWPTYNGAIGFTYEQGGSGVAGRALVIANGDTLRLTDRLAHHFIAGWATLETTHRNRTRLLEEFNAFFQKGLNNPDQTYASYVIRSADIAPNRLEAFLSFLTAQRIQYGFPSNVELATSYTGYNYRTKSEEVFTPNARDIVISTSQLKSKLVKVLMEPETFLEDSITYDLTAWALPYAYDLEAYAVESAIALKDETTPIDLSVPSPPDVRPYAWLVRWNSPAQVQFLAALLNQDIRARSAEIAFMIDEERYEPGTLIITRTDNPQPGFHKNIRELAQTHNCQLIPVSSGMVDEGKDFGSGDVNYITKPEIALINGDGVSPTAFGELWHYFDSELEYPSDVIHTHYLDRVGLFEYDVVVLPSGGYRDYEDQLMEFVERGGKIIAIESAISLFANARREEEPITQLGSAIQSEKDQVENEEDETPEELLLEMYEDRERNRLSNMVAGSIYEVQLDDSHPLAFGMGASTFLIKRNSTPYPYLPKGSWTVGKFEGDAHRSGFTGSNLREKLQNTMALGVESYGNGTVIYMTDSPIIRQFWYAGKLLLGNAVFMANE